MTGAICAIAGAKVLYILTVIPDIAAAFNNGHSAAEILKSLMSGGLVFYGGLIGAAAGAYFASRTYGRQLTEFLKVFMPAVCIFHGFGRIGCFLTGCCYGVETASPIGVVFTHSEFAPCGVPLIPVQLIESAGIFILFFILHFYSGKCRHGIAMLLIYIYIYAPFRFILEFFRGDAERGHLGALSTSQWISIFLVAFAVAVSYIFAKKVQG